jgi:hypothetical protein
MHDDFNRLIDSPGRGYHLNEEKKRVGSRFSRVRAYQVVPIRVAAPLQE